MPSSLIVVAPLINKEEEEKNKDEKKSDKKNSEKENETHEEEEELLRQYMVERTEPTEGIFVSSNYLQQNGNPFGERYLTPEENINKQQMYREMSVIVEDDSDSWQIIRQYEEEVFKRDKDKIVKEIMDEIWKRE